MKQISSTKEKAFFTKWIKKVLREGKVGGNKNLFIALGAYEGDYWFDWSDKDGYNAGSFSCSPMWFEEGDGVVLPPSATRIGDYKYDGDERNLTEIAHSIIDYYNYLVASFSEVEEVEEKFFNEIDLDFQVLK